MDSKKKEKQILQSRSEFEDTIQEGQLVTALVYMPEAISEVSKMIPTNKVFQNESIRFVYDAILTLYLSNMEIKKSSVLQTVIKSGRVQAIKSSG